MAVNLSPPGALVSVAGARWATASAAIKSTDRPDMALLALPETATTAGVFTQNAFAAAPVALARQHMVRAQPRALVINSGNANAGTGDGGLSDARRCCEAVAETLGVAAEQVLPFSTGVIGERLPLTRMLESLASVNAGLSETNWRSAAEAIMTTDTVPKVASRSIEVIADNGETRTVTLTGMAKGAGMIRPDMATMLAFIVTNACVDAACLDAVLRRGVAASFNCISVDGDTSTNDACMLCATGQGAALVPGGAGWQAFEAALTALMQELAQAIVRDGEGATRFLTLAVGGAADQQQARAVAFAVAHSPLVKTASFAADPNWGRILAAVGRAPVDTLDISRISITLDDVALITDGQVDADYREADGARVMARTEYTIGIDLGCGDAAATVWTSDLSYEYIRINAGYRS